MVNVLKFRTLFYFCSQIKCLLSWLKFTKCLSISKTGKKQSDLGLRCLSRLFAQTTSGHNFRTVQQINLPLVKVFKVTLSQIQKF